MFKNISHELAFVLKLSLNELKQKKRVIQSVNGEEIIVRLKGNNAVAYSGFCPHQGGPLTKGKVKDGLLFCPWHGCSFDLNDGVCVDTGSCRNVSKDSVKLKQFKCDVREGMVYVDEQEVL